MQVNSKESNGDPPLRSQTVRMQGIYIIIAVIIVELKGKQGKEERLEGLPILCFFVAQVCINKSYCFRHNVVGHTVPIDMALI